MWEGARRGKRGSSEGKLDVLNNPTSRSGAGTTYQCHGWASASAERTALDCPGGFAKEARSALGPTSLGVKKRSAIKETFGNPDEVPHHTHEPF